MGIGAQRRFWIGGGGALLPLLVTLIATDLSSIIDHYDLLTPGLVVGTGIRYLALFVLGGIVAMANTDEQKAIKLVQLGIAAPALISSYLNVGSPSGGALADMSLIRPAIAAPMAEPGASVQVAGFLRDVLRGSTGTVGEAVKKEPPPRAVEPVEPPHDAAPTHDNTPEARARRREALELRKRELERELRALEVEDAD